MADQLVGRQMIATLPDIYELDVEDFGSLELFGEKRAQNLVDAIDAARETTLARFLFGLGIPEVGRGVARDLARHFDTLDTLRSATPEDLEALHGFGEVIAHAIHDFFHDEHNRAALERLVAVVTLRNPDRVASGGDDAAALEGLTFVFTGSLETMTRNDAKELVERHGAKASGSVSGSTDYLVAGAGGGKKRSQAEANGVPILSEAEFAAFLDERGIELGGGEG